MNLINFKITKFLNVPMLLIFLLSCYNRKPSHVDTDIINNLQTEEVPHIVVSIEEESRNIINNYNTDSLQTEEVLHIVVPIENETTDENSMREVTHLNESNEDVEINRVSLISQLYENHKPPNIYRDTTKIIFQFLLILGVIFTILFCLSLDFQYLYFTSGIFILSLVTYSITKTIKK